ncbi:homeodomain-like containing protein [Theileria orientalis]|uniref:Homeodomain-like containing protein n=1 Tax=Theileria orientalis TaxID=68886 RepID=A0A976M5H0_THEOR|nr:homeodomain-like containing protein [Theileria orientalis]
MVNLMQSSNHPSQRQPEPQYKGNPYPVGMPHSLLAATMYEGSVRNFHSNPVSSYIMSKSKSAISLDHIDLSNVDDLGRYFKPYSDHLLEDKRVDDYDSWAGNRVSKYTACSNIIANEISHLYNRDDLNFDDWQYLLLYNKFKKILTERGTCSPETITFLIYNLINMVKNDLTLRNLLMISSDEYVEEVLTKFVEMALNQRIYGYEYTKPNMDAHKLKSSRKHLQRSSVAASMANTVSKAWGWKDSEHPCPIQAPSQLKPENFFVYGRHMPRSDENITMKDGCIPVPRVVYRSNDVKVNKKSSYSSEPPFVCNTPYGCESQYPGDKSYDRLYSHDTSYSCDTRLEPSATLKEPLVSETAATPREPEKKKNSKRYGPRGPYKRTLIRMRMREISRMRRHIKNKTNDSFFLNSEFDNSVKDLKGEGAENNKKGEEPVRSGENNGNVMEGELLRNSEDKIIGHDESIRGGKTNTGQAGKQNELMEQTGTVRSDGIVDPEHGHEVSEGINIPDGVSSAIVARTIAERRREAIIAANIEKARAEEKRADLNKGGDCVPPPTSKMYAYYTSLQDGYIDPHMIYSSNASTNNSISSSPIANDYFNDAQSTRFNSEATSEDFNYPEITYGINRPLNIHEVRNKEFGYYEPSKRDLPIYAEGIEFRPVYHSHTQDPMMEYKKVEKEAQPLRKYTTEGPYHSKPIPDTIGEKRSNRSRRHTKIPVVNQKIAAEESEIVAKNGASKPKENSSANAIHEGNFNENLEFDDEKIEQERTNGINANKKSMSINGIDSHIDIKKNGIDINKVIGIQGIDKDIEIVNDVKNKDVDIRNINVDIIRNGTDVHDEVNDVEEDKVGIIDIDINEKHVTIATGKGKEDNDEKERDDADEKPDEEHGERKRKEEHTIWDMVQKHHKSSHVPTPIVVKNVNNTNSEAADEKDDMSLLIREHYHISENVPSSQTLPFPNAYKNPKCVKWSYTETKRFYNAIETFGTDLLMVRAFMPEFTDRQVYDKFKLEERKNPQLMQNALQTHKSISLKQYEQKHGKIDTTTHYNPHTDPLLQGEATTTKSGLQLNPDAAEHFDTEPQPKVDDKIINLFM